MSLISRVLGSIGIGGAQARTFGGNSRAYDAARNDTREMAGFQPQLSSPDAEMLGGRDKITARVRDMDRNNAWFNGGINTRTDAIVGAKIRLEAKPDFEAMGKSPEWAEQWATKVEAEFRIWANDARFLCDVERDFQFGGLVRLAYLQFAREGEACAAIYDLDRGGPYQTAVLVVDADRLENRDNAPDSRLLRGGVHLDANGAAVAYDLRVDHPGDIFTDFAGLRWETVPRESMTGRPRFIHVKSKRRPQQRRGVSMIAAGLSRFKMLDRYDRAELEAALWNAINAFFIESPAPADQVREAFAPSADANEQSFVEQQMDFRADNPILIGGGVQGIQLMPGEKAGMLNAERPASNFSAFEGAVLRSLAGQFGLSYQQLSQDWSSINYSSARTLLNETWRGLMADRHLFSQGFCTPIYAAWLEEAIGLGRVKVPGGPTNFYRWRSALTMADWIGPGRGKIDPVKESTAGDLDLASNRSSLQMQCAEQGVDYRDIMLQRSRERAMAQRLNIPEAAPVVQAQAQADPNAHPDAEDHASAQEAA